MMNPAPLPLNLADDIVRRCIAEDLGTVGDITAQTTLAEGLRAKAAVVVRQDGCIAGLAVAMRVFALLEANVTVTPHVSDGAAVTRGAVLATVAGAARDIVTGERSALNILSHASGVATATREMVSLIADLPTKLVDTRTTTPGLRALEKYAVRVGGGHNHRFGLYDVVLIKDNHIAATGSITAAVEGARAALGHTIKIEVEIDRLDQLAEAFSVGADVVMLDNMSITNMKTAVKRTGGAVTLEASGRVTRDNIRAIAETGVDVISVGWLTHSAPALDIAFDLTLDVTD